MTLQGKWRIVELPDYEADFADMMGPAYILFGPARGEFAFGCVTGAIHGAAETEAVVFTWDGNDEQRLRREGDRQQQLLLHASTTILGFNTGWVKGKGNNNFSQANPGDILATNGVIHVIGDVLIP